MLAPWNPLRRKQVAAAVGGALWVDVAFFSHKA
jgi:hypothetical protein